MFKIIKTLVLFASLIALIFLNQNCSSPQSADSSANNTAGATDIQITLLKDSSYSLGADIWKYHLYKLSASDGSVAYVQWVPPLNSDVNSSPDISSESRHLDFFDENFLA